MEALSKLFGGSARVKVMRLFLLNPEQAFAKAEIKTKSQVSASSVTKEVSSLKAAGLIKQKSFYQETTDKNGKIKKRKVSGWQLDESFPYLERLKRLVVSSDSFDKRGITQKLRGVGKVNLAVLSGVFIDEDAGRIDLLLVGDKINQRAFATVLRGLESEVGNEIRYALLDTNDFLYRIDLCDRFVRDILDFPHEKLIDKLNV